MKIIYKQKPLSAIIFLLPFYASAQTPGVTEVERVVVRPALNNDDLIGKTIGYSATGSDAATKLKDDLKDTAQSVSVVTRQQIEDQRPASLSQALNYSAGAFSGLVGAANRYDYIAIRGFNENMTDNVLIDGQRLLSDSNTYSSMQIDPYFIERIDMVKGPVSSAYGRSTPGGVVAATTKRPLHEAYHEINLFGGTGKQRGAGIDLTGNLDKNGSLAYRLTGLAKHADSQNDHHKSRRYAVAPSLSWNITPGTNLLLQAYIQNDPQGGYHSGLPSDGTITAHDGFKFPRSFSDGEPTDRFKRRQNIYSYQLNHAFGHDWQFASKFRYADVRTESRQTWQTGWSSADTLLRSGGGTREHLKSFAFDNYFKGRIHTGIFEHTLLLGSDYQQRKTNADSAYNYTDISPINVFNPVYDNTAYTYTDYPSYNRFKLTQWGFYARDRIKAGNWHTDVGLRHDRVETSQVDRVTGVKSSDWKGGKTTWNVSVLHAFDNGISPYLSYGTGFNPNTYTDSEGKLLRPTESRQIEAGVKYQPSGTDNLFTIAWYDLLQKNVANRVINGNYYIPNGEVRSRGMEAEAKVNLTKKWFLQGALAYNDAEFRKSTVGLDGKTPYQSPKFTAALWSNYNFDNGVSLSGGVRHIRDIWADNENTLKVPAYTLVDLGVRYNFGKLASELRGLHGSVGVNNLFDKTYVSSCAGLTYCYYGERRNVSANISYRW